MPTIDQPPTVFDLNETAEAMRCGTTTIRRLIADGSLVSAKIGRRRVVTADSVAAYLAQITGTASATAAAGERA